MSQNQQNGKQLSDNRVAFNALWMVANGGSMCLLPFLRHRMGSNAIGWNGVFALIFMWVYGDAAQCPEIIGFFCVWIFFVLVRRIESVKLARNGVVIHSRYAGDPLIMRLLPFIKRKDATAAEIALCLLIGGLTYTASPSLGGFILTAAICLLIVGAIEEQAFKNRVTAMRDAAIEQRAMAEAYRNGQF